jgi:hypothetical protein
MHSGRDTRPRDLILSRRIGAKYLSGGTEPVEVSRTRVSISQFGPEVLDAKKVE